MSEYNNGTGGYNPETPQNPYQSDARPTGAPNGQPYGSDPSTSQPNDMPAGAPYASPYAYGQQSGPGYQGYDYAQQPQYQQSQQYQQPYQQPQYSQQPPQYQQYPYGYQQNAPYGYVPRQKLVAGLLGIFLGSLGVHNFYLGYTGKAIAQLLLTLVGWVILIGPAIAAIWGLVEGVMILCSNYGTSWHRDARGVELRD